MRRIPKQPWRVALSLAVSAVLSAVLSAVVPPALPAQTVAGETGVIEGVVTDEGGAALSGVRVAVRSAGTRVDLELATSARGRYGAVGLPAGSYSVEVWREGLSSAIAENVALDAGETLRLDFALTAGSGIAITVISSPRIDVASPARLERVPAERLDQLPGWLRFSELARLAAAITDLPAPRAGLEPVREGVGAVEVRGRALADGSLLIDGADAGDAAAPPLELDAVAAERRALEVTAGSLHPAFAGAPGGTVRLAAPFSGSIGDPWRFGLDLGVAVDGLGEAVSEGRALGGADLEREAADAGDLAASLGGVSREGRFGLFAAAVARREEITQSLAEGAKATQELDEESATLRVAGMPAPRLRLALTASRVAIEGDGLLADAPRLSAAALAVGGDGRRESRRAALALDLAVAGRFHLHGWAGWRDGERRDPADGSDRLVYLTSSHGLAGPGFPAELDQEAGFSTGKPGLAERSEREGRALRAHAIWLAGDDHRLAFGVELRALDLEVERELRGARTDVRWGGAGPGFLGTRYDLSAALEGSIEHEREALFVEDQWRLGRRLTLELGLRAESERWSATGGALEIGRGLGAAFEEALEPRLGLAWDVLGDGNSVVYLTADRHHRPLAERLAVAALGRVEIRRSVGAFASAEELAGSAAARPVLGLSGPVAVDPALEPERWHQVALGTEQLVIPGLRVRAEASYRELDRGVALVFVEPAATGASTGAEPTAVLANPGRGMAQRPYGAAAPEHPGMAARRFGVEMAADVRLGGRWTAGGAYTYSKAEGNADGSVSAFEDSASLAAFGAAQGSAEILPAPVCARLEGCFGADGSPASGGLLADRRHRWKVYGSLALPHGIDFAAYFQYLSGQSLTPRIATVSESGGMLAAVGAVAVVNAEGGGLGDPVSQLDLEASWSIQAGPFAQEGRRLSLVLQVSNVLDEHRALGRWDRLTLEPIVVPRAAFFAGFDALALAEAQGVALDPRFGQPRLVQRPREARLGLRLAF